MHPELEPLIEAVLEDGVITEKEREVLHRKAVHLDIDVDELDIIVNARLHRLNKAAAAARTETTTPCPSCAAPVSDRDEACAACGFIFEGDRPVKQAPSSTAGGAALAPVTQESTHPTPVMCPACERVHDVLVERCEACEEPLLLDGRLTVTRKLGQGGSSAVYAAYDAEAGRPIALKVLDVGKLNDWKRLELFKRQHEVLAGLDVDGVPDAFAYFEVDIAGSARCCIEQELIEGETLQDQLDRGRRFTEAEALQLLSKLLDILEVLHQLSPPLIHRDIKPSNLMSTPEGGVYLLDFDSATGDSAATSPSDATLVGTAGFVPLEQLVGQAGPASDVYAVGMTLVALLSRQPVTDLPVEGGRVRFEGAIKGSAGLDELLRGMLAPAVEERLPSAEAVRATAVRVGLLRRGEAWVGGLQVDESDAGDASDREALQALLDSVRACVLCIDQGGRDTERFFSVAYQAELDFVRTQEGKLSKQLAAKKKAGAKSSHQAAVKIAKKARSEGSVVRGLSLAYRYHNLTEVIGRLLELAQEVRQMPVWRGVQTREGVIAQIEAKRDAATTARRRLATKVVASVRDRRLREVQFWGGVVAVVAVVAAVSFLVQQPFAAFAFCVYGVPPGAYFFRKWFIAHSTLEHPLHWNDMLDLAEGDAAE